jgi:hypothetical protein
VIDSNRTLTWSGSSCRPNQNTQPLHGAQSGLSFRLLKSSHHLFFTTVCLHWRQLASNFVTFFEKLAKACERIAQELPQYKEIAALSRRSKGQPSLRLRNSLCNVYDGLFKFFQSVARVFTKKDGSKSKAWLFECVCNTNFS